MPYKQEREKLYNGVGQKFEQCKVVEVGTGCRFQIADAV